MFLNVILFVLLLVFTDNMVEMLLSFNLSDLMVFNIFLLNDNATTLYK